MSHAEDRTEISELLDRHQIYIDLADAEGYAGLYTPDGTYQSPFGSSAGRDAIVEMFVGLRESGFTHDKRHFTGPRMIDLDGDSATVRSYWWVADYAGDGPAVFATGTYVDDLVRLDGVWLIARRIQTMDSPAQGS